ncbi:MAG: proton extrusion protein PcxA [Richelia sp. RM2_1_2]|nr:proton extrusion protein PcxA [Richelia sp. SM2_1_7]NJM18825.1 proton extrusion protein PcxA [Richelia sp. SM1_7_0]NJN07725.1 proton extrusion protein PcxA [Richelia sp. RM1_1_1]NJO27323.1 proton extrusion protein PcxA [Richelia sp. SL_2_1]NJO59479.1 proton extrusion protein PcxA [Richelia sp. RM2_1_2]
MKNFSVSQKIYSYLVKAYQWYLRTQERSLDEAYKAALQIKVIEDEHFNGQKIDINSVTYSTSVMDYFESDLKQLLRIVRMRLTEFKASHYLLNESNLKAANKFNVEHPNSELVLEKLRLIDQIVAKYTTPILQQTFTQDAVIPSSTQYDTIIPKIESEIVQTRKVDLAKNQSNNQPKGKVNTTGVLPRSIFNTFNRLQVELDPNAEQDVVEKFRTSQRRTIISVRFLLLLIIIPILTHQISKAILVSPIINHFRSSEQSQLFINYEMEEEALLELERFEEKIKFQTLINSTPLLSPQEMEEKIEEQVKDKALEIAEKYQVISGNAIKNVFADIISVCAFIWFLMISKREIAVLKDFFDYIVYGLSDSAKAFIIILFTDIFVGFHSPHGWEVILEGISRHWGLPANHEFIFLFIATFPVILDTIFKYWIFRYLNRISPSAVATYRNMNE